MSFKAHSDYLLDPLANKLIVNEFVDCVERLFVGKRSW